MFFKTKAKSVPDRALLIADFRIDLSDLIIRARSERIPHHIIIDALEHQADALRLDEATWRPII